MATTIKSLFSEGGFGVNGTTLVTPAYDFQNVNSLTIKNSNYSDAKRREYILKGTNTAVLTVDGTFPITLDSNTINFITGYIVAVNPDGSGHYSAKIESAVTCGSSGSVSILSELFTTIKDSVPTGQTWTVASYAGGVANQFSYTTTRGGTTNTIKWIANTQIVSVSWV
jgi:hypothetical protein